MSEVDEGNVLGAQGMFILNMLRVRDLVSAARYMPPYEGEGRDLRSDMVRAGVLLSHAALEDLLRSLVGIRLPYGDEKHLQKIPMIDSEEKPKLQYDLGNLATHRGKSVSAVITRSVLAHLSLQTYNNVSDIAHALDQIGVSRSLKDAEASNLAAMMIRRHHIAHKADRYEASGAGDGVFRAIDSSIVSTWIDSVNRFGSSLLRVILAEYNPGGFVP